MQKFLILTVLVSSLFFEVAARTVKGSTNSIPSIVAPALVTTNALRQPMESLSLSPGVYATAPYSMQVVVPRPVDPLMVRETDISQFTMPCIRPKLEFK